ATGRRLLSLDEPARSHQLRTADTPAGFIDKYPSQRLPAQTSEHAAKRCERRRDHWYGQEKQLPRRTHLFLLQTIWVSTGDDFDRGSKPLEHVPGGGGKKVLVQFQRGKEQVGTRCVELRIKPRGAQLAFRSVPPLARVSETVPVAVSSQMLPEGGKLGRKLGAGFLVVGELDNPPCS